MRYFVERQICRILRDTKAAGSWLVILLEYFAGSSLRKLNRKWPSNHPR